MKIHPLQVIPGQKLKFVHFEKPEHVRRVVQLFECSDWLDAEGETTVWGNGVFLLQDEENHRLTIYAVPGKGYMQ